MTMVVLPTPVSYPGFFSPTGTGLASTGNGTTMDAAGEYFSLIFQAIEAMTISHIGFRPGTVVGAGTPDLRVETVDASGLPSGALWAANTNKAGDTLTSSTWTGMIALTAAANIAAGDWVCIKIGLSSGTSFTTTKFNNGDQQQAMRSYRVINTGTPTKGRINADLEIVGIGSSAISLYYIPGIMPCNGTVTSTDFNNASGTVRYGIRFRLPFDCKVRGVNYNSAQVGNFTVALYNDAGTLLASKAIDGDYAINFMDRQCFTLDAEVSIARNTWYRATVEATTVTNCELLTVTLPSVDMIGGTAWRANAHLTTWNGSAWDDTNTAILPCMNLMITQMDDGAGAAAAVAAGAAFGFA